MKVLLGIVMVLSWVSFGSTVMLVNAHKDEIEHLEQTIEQLKERCIENTRTNAINAGVVMRIQSKASAGARYTV